MDVPGTFPNRHRFTKQEVKEYPDAIVKAVNAVSGPRLRAVQGKGYGLFADRDYEVGERVTTYGGVWDGPEVNNPYVIGFSGGQRLDGEYGFKASEKGRWINDPQTDMRQTPDELMRLENVNVFRQGNDVGLFATRNIRNGEEILWYYGDEYNRTWLLSPSPSSSSTAVPSVFRRMPMIEQLRHEGADEEYIARLQAWLSPHGYSLDSFDMHAVRRDPQFVESMPRDLRNLLMRSLIDAALDEHPDEPCVAVAWLMRLSTSILSLAEILNNDDRVWHRFWIHDFEPFGERAMWWTSRRLMPWRSAYLWTVFFRRRCLRELAAQRSNSLGMAKEQTFRPIDFGTHGCVTAVAVYERGWHEELAHFTGYAGVTDLTTRGQFVYPISRHSATTELFRGVESIKDTSFYASPGQALRTFMFRTTTDAITLDDWLGAWTEHFNPLGTGSLSEAVLWNYSAALMAYCWLDGADLTPYEEDFFRIIFDSLPEVPDLSGRLYLGAKV